MVSALERALDGDPVSAAKNVDDLTFDPLREPDLLAWLTAIYALAGRDSEAVQALKELRAAPPFLEVFRQLGAAGLIRDSALWTRLLASAEPSKT